MIPVVAGPPGCGASIQCPFFSAIIIMREAKPWHGVDHTENFPVASWLVPAALRPAIVAIYHFARHADDLADEGEADAAERDRSLLALGNVYLPAGGA